MGGDSASNFPTTRRFFPTIYRQLKIQGTIALLHDVTSTPGSRGMHLYASDTAGRGRKGNDGLEQYAPLQHSGLMGMSA